jgi:hypothetical protein
MSLFFKFDSFEKIKKLFKDLSTGMKNATRETGRLLINEAEQLAKDRVRSPSRKPGKGSGPYFQSIHSSFKGGKVSFTGSLESDSPIAGVIEFGSRPHIIRPKNNKLLFWPGARHPVKEVKHPGTPAFRVLGDAVEEASLQTGEIFEKALKKQFGDNR